MSLLCLYRVRARWSVTKKTPWGEVEATSAARAAEKLLEASGRLEKVEGTRHVPVEVTLKGEVNVRLFSVELWRGGCQAHEVTRRSSPAA